MNGIEKKDRGRDTRGRKNGINVTIGKVRCVDRRMKGCERGSGSCQVEAETRKRGEQTTEAERMYVGVVAGVDFEGRGAQRGGEWEKSDACAQGIHAAVQPDARATLSGCGALGSVCAEAEHQERIVRECRGSAKTFSVWAVSYILQEPRRMQIDYRSAASSLSLAFTPVFARKSNEASSDIKARDAQNIEIQQHSCFESTP
ncbi:hypothetical protein C8R44DRAFT_742002 [Mycena epipterygia]|nr:hypothetical protein C8R44DRAFT_742002 [Mycena epipterygia]